MFKFIRTFNKNLIVSQITWERKIRAEAKGMLGRATVKPVDTQIIKFKNPSEDVFEFGRDHLRVYSHSQAEFVQPDSSRREVFLDLEVYFFRLELQSVSRQYSAAHNAHVVTLTQHPLTYECYFEDVVEASSFARLISNWKCKGTLNYT